MREEKQPEFPISLSSKERKKLAKAARELAMECLTNGPQMSDHWSGGPSECGCAIHHVLVKAGMPASGAMANDLEGWFSDLPPGARAGGVLSVATRMRVNGTQPTAVVFPLLAFADMLEEVP